MAFRRDYWAHPEAHFNAKCGVDNLKKTAAKPFPGQAAVLLQPRREDYPLIARRRVHYCTGCKYSAHPTEARLREQSEYTQSGKSGSQQEQ
jgi:hypothetical protein